MEKKYFKYRNKYLNLKKQIGGLRVTVNTKISQDDYKELDNALSKHGITMLTYYKKETVTYSRESYLRSVSETETSYILHQRYINNPTTQDLILKPINNYYKHKDNFLIEKRLSIQSLTSTITDKESLIIELKKRYISPVESELVVLKKGKAECEKSTFKFTKELFNTEL